MTGLWLQVQRDLWPGCLTPTLPGTFLSWGLVWSASWRSSLRRPRAVWPRAQLCSQAELAPRAAGCVPVARAPPRRPCPLGWNLRTCLGGGSQGDVHQQPQGGLVVRHTGRVLLAGGFSGSLGSVRWLRRCRGSLDAVAVGASPEGHEAGLQSQRLVLDLPRPLCRLPGLRRASVWHPFSTRVCLRASPPPRPGASPGAARWGVVWRLGTLGDPGPPQPAARLRLALCASPRPARPHSGTAVARPAPCLAGVPCPSRGRAWSGRSCLFSLRRRGGSSGPAPELVGEARGERGRPVRVRVCNKSVFKRFCVVTFAAEIALCGRPPNPRHLPSMWPVPCVQGWRDPAAPRGSAQPGVAAEFNPLPGAWNRRSTGPSTRHPRALWPPVRSRTSKVGPGRRVETVTPAGPSPAAGQVRVVTPDPTCPHWTLT